MSQQINLYDPALRRTRELLTARNVAAASAALLVVLSLWGLLARMQLGRLEGENQVLDPQVKQVQAQKDMLAAQLAVMKPDPKIEAELASSREMLDMRTRQLNELKRGMGTESAGFGDYLRGFARQTPQGLWLTGFNVAEGGSRMEIRGRMMDPALLPEYIRKLNGEQAFAGHEFAMLKIATGRTDAGSGAAPAPAPQTAPAGPAPAIASPAPATAPVAAPFYEFALASTAPPEGASEVPAGGPR